MPNWKNRILVDAANPLASALAGLSVRTTSSGAEEIAIAARGARVVKACNITGAENSADSHYPGGTVFMPVCGDDAGARARLIALAKLIGFNAVACGDLKAARYLGPFAVTWIHTGDQARAWAPIRLCPPAALIRRRPTLWRFQLPASTHGFRNAVTCWSPGCGWFPIGVSER